VDDERRYDRLRKGWLMFARKKKLFLGSGSLSVGTTWVQRDPSGSSTPNYYRNVIISADGQTISVAPYGGGIYISINGGSTWALSRSTAQFFVKSAASNSAVYQYFVDNGSGECIHTANGGSSWSSYDLTAGSSYSIAYAICCSSDGSKVFVPQGAGVSISTNFGVTWTHTDISGMGGSEDACCSYDGSIIYFPTSSGHITKSSNSGSTWAQLTTDGTTQHSKIACNSDGSHIVGCRHNVAAIPQLSINGGATWSNLTSAGSSLYNSVAMSANGSVIVLLGGDGGNIPTPGYIKVSTDGGTTFTQITSAGSKNWHTVAMSRTDPTNLAAVVNDSTTYGFPYTSTY
jgi:hypothetical protein